MAGPGHLLSELQRQLERFDDEAFTALASAGLLRRACKDLETLAPTLAERGDALTVELGPQRVSIDARGPAHARCSCPSRTTCQHVLAACLYLKSLAAPVAVASEPDKNERPQVDLQAELMAISLEALVAYAGKAAVRAALQALEEGDVVQFSVESTIVIRLRKPAIELRYAGGGPESFIVDFRGRTLKKLVALAIVAFQRAHGATLESLPGETRIKEPAKTAVSDDVSELRATLLPKVERLLCECIDVGLPHLSDSFTERLLSLATIAEGAKLHRLSLALSRLSSQIDLMLERHALADSTELLSELAKTYALVNALRDPQAWTRVELVGEARTAYEEMAALDLYCAAAYPWQTASGYWGLTVLFWSAAQARWFSYSDARPSGTLGFTPKDAYRTAGPWKGCNNPAAIAGHRVKLAQASANRFGRLSGSASTTASVESSAVPDFGSRAYRSWSELRAASQRRLDGIGLIESNPHDEYVVLYPRRFMTKSFADTTQTLLWPMQDENNDELLLRLEYSPIAAHAVERLDSMQPDTNFGIVAQLDWTSGELTARPLSILRTGAARTVDNLFLDDAPHESFAGSLFGKLRTAMASLPSVTGRSADSLRQENATERMLAGMDAALLKIAERGSIAQSQHTQELSACLRRLHDGGLSMPLDAEARIDARFVLKACYIALIARESSQRI